MKINFTWIILLFVGNSLLGQSNSLNMDLVGSWDDDQLPSAFYGAFNEIWGYTDCDGHEYAIIGSSAYVHFFDLADPTQPVEIDRFEGGDVTVWRDMKTYGDRAYSVCDGCSEGMMIFDLSDLPNSVTKVDQTNAFFDNSHNIFVDEAQGRLYAAGTNTTSFGLVVLDLNDNPDAPQLIGNELLPGGYIHDLYVRDNLVYANSAGNGLYIYDFTDASNPVVLGTMTEYEEQGYNHSGWLNDAGTKMVMMDETHGTGVKLVDVSDFDAISVESIFRSTLLAPDFTNSVGHNAFIRGNLAFVSYYHDGLQVFDLTDPENVEKVAFYDTELGNTDYEGYTGNWGVYPFLPSGLILASDMHNGLHIFSLDSLIGLTPTFPITYPDVAMISGDTAVCYGETIELFTTGTASTYQWMLDGNVIADSDTPSLEVTESGNYDVLASNLHCSVLTEAVNIDFHVAATPTIIFDSAGFSTASPASSYQWYLNGVPIPGATESTYIPTMAGVYTVEITDDFGCSAVSENLELVSVDGIPSLDLNGQLELFPNPASQEVQLSLAGVSQTLQYNVLGLTGRKLQTGTWNTASDLFIQVSDFPAGLYMIQLWNESGQVTHKLVVE